jgi:putative toxin-antitoxin system antitoxin component (TIGR02293 family)
MKEKKLPATVRSRRARSPALAGSISAEQVRKGLPVQALIELARSLNVERGSLANILGTSVRTLQRRSEENDRLGPVESDRLARVRRILELATHVLGEETKASRWLTSQSRALDGEVPLDMLDTDAGTQRVQQELRQIEFGMPL